MRQEIAYATHPRGHCLAPPAYFLKCQFGKNVFNFSKNENLFSDALPQISYTYLYFVYSPFITHSSRSPLPIIVPLREVLFDARSRVTATLRWLDYHQYTCSISVVC